MRKRYKVVSLLPENDIKVRGSNKIVKLLAVKVSFLILFSFYYSTISFFPHQHLIGDSFIVHSHPYKKDCNGNTSHTHSTKEIQTIYTLSVFLTTTVIISLILGKIILLLLRNLNFISCYKSVAVTSTSGYNRLRPPPTHYYFFSSVLL